MLPAVIADTIAFTPDSLKDTSSPLSNSKEFNFISVIFALSIFSAYMHFAPEFLPTKTSPITKSSVFAVGPSIDAKVNEVKVGSEVSSDSKIP